MYVYKIVIYCSILIYIYIYIYIIYIFYIYTIYIYNIYILYIYILYIYTIYIIYMYKNCTYNLHLLFIHKRVSRKWLVNNMIHKEITFNYRYWELRKNYTNKSTGMVSYVSEWELTKIQTCRYPKITATSKAYW